MAPTAGGKDVVVGTDQHASAHGAPSAAYAGVDGPPHDLAAQLGDLARDLQAQPEPARLLGAVTAAAVTHVPGAEDASISVVVGRHRVRSQASTSELARAVDALQEEVGEGPCLDATFARHTVRLSDLEGDDRWPAFCERARAAGVGSMLSFQLFVEGDDLGALNLYSRRRCAFDDRSEDVGLLLATHAAVAFAGAQREAAMRRALETRSVVGRAQGVLMERHGATAEEAFDLLVRASQCSGVKLHAVAERLVRAGLRTLQQQD